MRSQCRPLKKTATCPGVKQIAADQLGVRTDAEDVAGFDCVQVVRRRKRSGDRAHQPRRSTCRSFVTENTPGTPLARMFAISASPLLATTPSRVT